jgi:hypothetical protein
MHAAAMQSTALQVPSSTPNPDTGSITECQSNNISFASLASRAVDVVSRLQVRPAPVGAYVGLGTPDPKCDLLVAQRLRVEVDGSLI